MTVYFPPNGGVQLGDDVEGEFLQSYTLGATETTSRGFEFIEFVDHNGEPCSLQQSSLAEFEQPGTSAIWLGCEKNAAPVDGHEMAPRMHLTYEQVTALVEHLQAWLDTGSLGGRTPAQPEPQGDDGDQQAEAQQRLG